MNHDEVMRFFFGEQKKKHMDERTQESVEDEIIKTCANQIGISGKHPYEEALMKFVRLKLVDEDFRKCVAQLASKMLQIYPVKK